MTGLSDVLNLKLCSIIVHGDSAPVLMKNYFLIVTVFAALQPE